MSDSLIPAPIHTFTASDGYRWSYRRYDPTSAPRGVIVCLHGIQSHGGWYEHSSSRLCQAGFRVFYLDRRGSGLNQQDRGDTPSYRQLLRDVAEFLRSPLSWADGNSRLPVFLSGVSWGGKLAVGMQRWQQVFSMRPNPPPYGDQEIPLVDGLILLCPGFFPRVGLDFRQLLGIGGARLVSRRKLFPIPLNDPVLFTASVHWREYIRNDPLALHKATARFLFESARLDRYLRKAPKRVTAPTLLLLAGKDRIIRNDKTQRFFQKFAATDKNVITYARAHHTLEFEPDPDRFLGEILRWLDRQCSNLPPRPVL